MRSRCPARPGPPAAIDILSRDIRRYTAAMFEPDMPHAQADLLASLIEEGGFHGQPRRKLYQVARRLERQPFVPPDVSWSRRRSPGSSMPCGRCSDATAGPGAAPPASARRLRSSWRHPRALPGAGGRPALGGARRDSELLGSAERALFLIARIDGRAPVGAAGGGRAGRDEPRRSVIPGSRLREPRRSTDACCFPSAPSSWRPSRARQSCTPHRRPGRTCSAGRERGAPGPRSSTRCCRAGRASVAAWLARGGDYPALEASLDDPPASSALEYEPVGSLAGLLRLRPGRRRLRGTDMPLKSDELNGLGLGQFPIVVGGVVVAVNADGVPSGRLKLTGPCWPTSSSAGLPAGPIPRSPA